MQKPICYTVLTKGQYQSLIDHVNNTEDLHRHALIGGGFMVINPGTLDVVITLGERPDLDYYWASFPLHERGYSLLTNALLLDK